MSGARPSDVELLRRTAAADEAAFQQLYERHAGRIFNFVLRFTHDHHEAENILQETFLRAFKKADTFQPRAEVSTWLFQIAMNLCRDRARRLPRREKTMEDLHEPGDATTPLVEVSVGESQRIVKEVLGGLPEEEKSVVLLRIFEKMTYEKVAEVVGCSERTARERMKRGRARFLQQLERWDTALAEVLGHGLP